MFIHMSLLFFFLFNSYITIDASSFSSSSSFSPPYSSPPPPSSSYGYNSSHLCDHQESLALLHFKQSLDIFNGYSKMMNWKTGTDCCRWDGVSCNKITGDVIGVDLSWGRVEGIIHPNSTLFRLPHLQRLNLAYTYFQSSYLPREIGIFANTLTHLDLSNALFKGQIPSEISLLHKLVFLDLSGNFFDAGHAFNHLFGNSTLLRQLSLPNVKISSELPGNLSLLSLTSLDLRGTGLHGKLPKNIFSLPCLRKLDLSGNDGLTGALPRVNSIPLESLGLSYCGFTGPFPKSLGNLRNLTHLDLSNNMYTRPFPKSLGNLRNLTHLDLSHNMLNGSLPSDLFTIQSLEYIDLSYSQLDGHIDASLTSQSFKHLTVLDLSYNNLIGVWELDVLFSSLTNLATLDLSYSGLSVVTTNINHYVLPHLDALRLASCNLTVFPGSLRANLSYINLSNNKIGGPIPEWIGGPFLSYLDLSHNLITAMGLALFQCEALYYLNLKSNLIQGPLPPSICNMKGGRMKGGILDLSNNFFGGVLPRCFGNLTDSLWLINVRNNHFHGTIPNVWGDCLNLEALILNGNQLDGELPRSLSNCNFLKIFDLGNNRFNDTFPVWTTDLPRLEVLVLKSNKFHGPITSSSTNQIPYARLRILDLSQNEFVGHLPKSYFGNFSAMKNVPKTSTKPKYMQNTMGIVGMYNYSVTVVMKGMTIFLSQILVAQTIIDLSENKFEGEIPDVIGILESLKGLNLSHNSLTGGIPHALGNLTEVESLDLSYNQLTGQIPQQLAQLTSLAVLNLSQNHLTGRIPQGPQFNTFQESFLGNPELCGLPLPNKCEPPPTTSKEEVDEDGESWFIWKVAVLGCGCGTPVGLVIGCLMFITKRPKWLAELVQGEEDRIRRRRKNKTRRLHIVEDNSS